MKKSTLLIIGVVVAGICCVGIVGVVLIGGLAGEEDTSISEATGIIEAPPPSDVEPTPTPVLLPPTSTPVPPPPPTDTPEAETIPPEASAYFKTVSEEGEIFAKGLTALGDLTNAPDFDDADWKLKVIFAGAFVVDAHKRLEDLDPPSDLAEAHATMLEGTGACAEAANHFASWIDNQDANTLAEGLLMQDTCKEKMDEAGKLFQEYLAQFQSATSISEPTAMPIPATNTPVPAEAPVPAAPRTDGAAHVLQVIDGDTIEVEIDAIPYRVRYIGVDTPEQGMSFYDEATQANASLVADRDVWLEKDVSETDRYDRLLRYVYVNDMMVNEELLRSGVAQVATFPPDVKYADRFLTVQQEAQAAGVGLWAGQAAPPPEPTAPPPEPTAGNCDPSYPDVCIPPPPPDLDCGDIPHRRFTVLPPDPHNFDGRDNDGVGCESD